MPRKTSKKVGARRTSRMRARASTTRKGARGASARGARSGAKRGASAHPIIDHASVSGLNPASCDRVKTGQSSDAETWLSIASVI
jgi:hypothetical protein